MKEPHCGSCTSIMEKVYDVFVLSARAVCSKMNMQKKCISRSQARMRSGVPLGNESCALDEDRGAGPEGRQRLFGLRNELFQASLCPNRA